MPSISFSSSLRKLQDEHGPGKVGRRLRKRNIGCFAPEWRCLPKHEHRTSFPRRLRSALRLRVGRKKRTIPNLPQVAGSLTQTTLNCPFPATGIPITADTALVSRERSDVFGLNVRPWERKQSEVPMSTRRPTACRKPVEAPLHTREQQWLGKQSLTRPLLRRPIRAASTVEGSESAFPRIRLCHSIEYGRWQWAGGNNATPGNTISPMPRAPNGVPSVWDIQSQRPRSSVGQAILHRPHDTRP